MSANRPLWLRTVHKLERTIGGPVESAVRSDRYFDTVTRVSKVRRTAIDLVEGVSRRGLHLFNLPAGAGGPGVREQRARLPGPPPHRSLPGPRPPGGPGPP